MNHTYTYTSLFCGHTFSSILLCFSCACSTTTNTQKNRCKAMYPCDDDNPRNMEQSLVLTGSQVPLEISAFTQHSAPETAIIIGISIVTEEACKCGSYHNNTGRRDDEDDRAGFSHVDALGELLPVILPFADYWYAYGYVAIGFKRWLVVVKHRYIYIWYHH